MGKEHTCPRCGQVMETFTSASHYICRDCRRSLYPWLSVQKAGL